MGLSCVYPLIVMPGPAANIHALHPGPAKTWMAGTSPAMTRAKCIACEANSGSLHRALVVERVLAIFDDGCDGVQRVAAISTLHCILQIEILDRNMIVAEFEWAAYRLEVGLFHFLAHAFLVGQVAFDRSDRAVDQSHGIVGLSAVERR